MDLTRVAAMLRTRGESVTLRRLGSPNVDVTVRAVRSGASAQEVVNGAARQTTEFLIGNTEIAASSFTLPIRAKDQVIDAGSKTWVIESVDTRRVGATNVTHRLRATGSA